MKLVNLIIAITIGVCLMSCEKVIDVDLDTAAPKLVIDASINWLENTTGNEQRIKLSTTTGYYNAEFPTVSDATIFITNSSNAVFNFPETSTPGEYRCPDFTPVVGETYTLTVVLNGVTYSAVETLTAAPEIDDSIHQNNSGGFAGDEIEIQFSYQDDGGLNNYYMTRIETNRVAFPEYFLESDEMFQGNKMVQYYSHEDLQQGDSINIELYGTSKRFFEYFKKILLASGSEGSPFPSTPTAVRGNIINQSDTENYVLGYFRLSEVASRGYTIQ